MVPPRPLLCALALACTLFTELPAAPAATEWLELGRGFAGSSINVVANRRHSLFTHQQEQYAAFYDADGFMVLARRRLGTSAWERQRTPHRGNVADAHNAISLAVDGAGHLHVAWDHHGQPLNYARSIEPGGLILNTPGPMTGRAEDRVTYPEFHVLPGGDLLCLYRDGGSGRGRLVLNRYELSTRRWSTVQPNLIDGEGARSPYWGVWLDAEGTLHLGWIWRETPDVATNHDLAYAQSRDGGVTWTSVQGRPMQPPFTEANAAYAARIPPGHNLMNSPWVTATPDGRPILLSYWSATPDEAPQFRAVYWQNNDWRQTQLTARASGFKLAGEATKRPPISRGVLLVGTPDQPDVAHLVYRDDAHGGRVLLRSAPALGSGRWTEQLLTEQSVGAWEPTIDPVLWPREQEIHLLVQPVTQRDGDDTRAAAVPPTVVGVLRVQPAETAAD